jgi:hypothetical protein
MSRLLIVGGLGAALVLSAGCVSAGPNGGTPSTSPAVSASPVASPSPAAAGSTSSTKSSLSPASTPSVPPATTDISPAQQQVGSFNVGMAIEPARHMLAQNTAFSTDPDPAHQAGTDSANAPGSTALVLEGLLQLTNNIDPSQPVPDDGPQAVLRHVRVEIRGSDMASTVAYLSSSIDLLLDGRPALANVPLEPMIAAESSTPAVYYGNNVKLVQRGTYQVFVRFQASPLLGKDPPPTAQFTLSVH